MSEQDQRELRDEFVRVDHTVVRLKNGTVYFLAPEEYDNLRQRRNLGRGTLYETVDIFGCKVAFDTSLIGDVSRHTNESMQRRKKFHDRIEEIMGEDENPWETN